MANDFLKQMRAQQLAQQAQGFQTGRTASTTSSALKEMRAQQLARQSVQSTNRNRNTAPSGAAAGKFYSPDSLLEQMSQAQKTMKDRQSVYEKADENLRSAFSKAQEKKKRIDMLEGRLTSQYGIDQLNLLKDEYNADVEKLGSLQSEAQSAYTSYRSSFDALSRLQGEYQSWKGTVRRGLTTNEVHSLNREKEGLEKINSQLNRDMAAAGSFGSAAFQSRIEKNLSRIREIDDQLSNTPQADEKKAQEKVEELTRMINGLGAVNRQLEKDSASVSLPGTVSPIQSQIEVNRARIRELEQELQQANAAVQTARDEAKWNDYFRYADRMEEADFDRLSKYKTTANGKEIKRSGADAFYETGFDNIVYDYINRNPEAVKLQSSRNLKEDLSYLEKMTDEEIGIYNYVYAKEGAQAASEYLEHIRTDLTGRRREDLEQDLAEQAKKNPVAASLTSLAMTPVKGLSFLGQSGQMLTRGKIDENAGYNAASYMSSAIRDAVSKTAEEKWGKVGSFLYQTGMSMGDFLLSGSMAAGSPGLALAIMGTGAAADTTIAAKDRGLGDKQAYTLGAVAGLAEVVTEKISIDALLDKTSLGKSAMGYILKNMAAEGGEEVASDLINLAADVLVAKDKSQWQQSIEGYVSDGMTREQAFARAVADQAASTLGSALGGALSGGVMGAGSVVLNRGKSPEAPDVQAPEGEQEVPAAAPEAVREMSEVSRNASLLRQTRDQIVAAMGAQLRTVEDDRYLRRLSSAETDLQISGVLAGAEDAQIESAQRLSDVLGKRILFEPADKGRNGWYKRSEDIIYLNPKSANPIAQVIGHELTHSIEVSTEDYGALQRLVQERIRKTGGNLDAMREQKIDLYAQNGVTISQAQADQEIIAEYIEKNLLTDEQAIGEMVRDNRSLARRILDWLDGLLAKLGNTNAQERQFVLQAREKYRSALEHSYGIHERNQMQQARMQAYAEGDDAAGDAMFDDQWASDGYVDQLLEDDLSDVQFSFGGENAEKADLTALRQAKQMETQGVDAETIRKSTGWFRGMEGKWRWEIDDSGMRYSRRGDLGFAERNPGYVRYRELLDKANRYALEMSDEAPTDAEREELKRLSEIWRGTFRMPGRITEDALPQDRLADYLKHDSLFENYPWLRDVKLKFADLPEGTRGQWNQESNTITLSNMIRSNPEGTLLHEIQHAIQDHEGFSGGASTEYWDGQMVTKPEYASEVLEAKESVKQAEDAFRREWGDTINLNLAKRYIELDNQLWEDETDPAKQQELADQMDQIEQAARESGWGDLFDDYYYAVGQLQLAKERAKLHRRTSIDLYRNTAGEIEARDSAGRRGLDSAGRKNTPPNLGDENTVFADGNAVQFSIGSIDGENGSYGTGVILDTNLFDHERPRAWGNTLSDFVYKNLAGVELTVYDDQGNPEKIHLARMEDRVKKDGAKNSHKVIDKLARVRGDNIKALATVHLSEMLETSRYENSTSEHSHQWMDENGWEYRKAYLQDRQGNIYEAILNIANGRDRRILYSISNIRRFDKKRRTTGGVVPSTQNGRGSHTSHSSSDKTVPHQEENVKQYSISETDSEGMSLSDQQRSFFSQSKITDAFGRLTPLFHQTGEVFTIFDTRRPGAGTSDSGTPFGIFLKRTANDIGLRGKRQMKLYANITNPLRTQNRQDLRRQFSAISADYAKIIKDIDSLNADYSARVEQAKQNVSDYMTAWRQQHPDASGREIYNDPRFNELDEMEDQLIEEWDEAERALSRDAKEAITRDIRIAGYDGIILQRDAGSWGRSTDAIIALDPDQVKSVSNTTPTNDPDIRYSISEEFRAEDLDQVETYMDDGSMGNSVFRSGWLKDNGELVGRIIHSRPLTQTDAFRNWFGESKAVNKDGEPLLVFHGTQERFSRFETDGKPIWFSNNPMYARAYAGQTNMADRVLPKGKVFGGASERIIPAYIRAENPVDLGSTDSAVESGFTDLAMRLGVRPADLLPVWQAAEDVENIWQLVNTREMADFLRERGYDSVMAVENGTHTWAVLGSDQVKSAVANSGRFDPNRDDIRYSISDESGKETTDPVAALPWKAQQSLKGVERKLINGVAKSLNVPYQGKRDFLQPIVQEISREYLRSGIVSQETANRLFETAYEQGRVVDEEFYNQYKDVKDYLRTQAVTLSERDQADIADFDDFRKRARYTLKIRNEGGLPVDTAWGELQEMAPELFPNDITHPADQLQHMLDVGQNIKKAEYTLERYYADDAEGFKAWAKSDFDAAISDAVAELRQVKRFGEDRLKKEQEVMHSDLTQEEVTALYPMLKETRRNYEKAMAKNLLTDEDQKQVGRLLRGDIELAHLNPERDNVKGITAVYEAKLEYEKYAKQIRQWNRSRKARLMAEAAEYTESANAWKDKRMGILYSRETMERNIRDIVPDKDLAERIIDAYIKPVHAGAAEANRTKNKYRDRIRALNLSQKAEGEHVSEAYAVQLLGEAEDNIRFLERSRGRIKHRDGKTIDEWNATIQDLWKENPQLDQAKIRGTVEEFRKIYDELFTQMNEARIRNGYEPVNYRQGYFPHFQAKDEEGVMALFGKALGIKTEVTALPTSINGLTHTFKPGIRWMGNALERKGFETAYDALEGFDRYIEGVADVIHQTDNIQRLRALEAQARYRTTDEGIRQQIDAVRAREDLTEIDKENRIKEIYENARYALSNFVVELEEYTNLLANKKSRADRNMEQAMGRDMYNLVKSLESRVAANMVAINPGSWLTNFIPLTQGAATLDKGLIWQGMLDTLKAIKNDDGFVDASSFLINRRGSDPLVQTWQQKTSAKMGKPMEIIDSFTADSLVRARFKQNVSRGMSDAAAMEEADQWAAGVMADRSKGSTPTLFNRSNPLTKLFTQFQLEVNNQLSYVFKDIPREAGERDKYLAALAMMLFKFAVGAFFYNEAYEYVIGRRPALDPLGILNDTVGDITGFELPNMVEYITGENRSLKTEKAAGHVAAGNLATNVLEELPFVGSLMGGGRLPISSALPDWENLAKAALNEEWSPEKRLATAASELGNPLTYLALPFGGGQAKKLWQGAKALIEGGSYTVDSQGNDILQYPLYADESMNALRALIFGKSTTTTGVDWIEGGFKNLSAKATAAYQDMLQAGVSNRDAYELVKEISDARKTGARSAEDIKRDILRGSDVSDEGKVIVYYALMANEKERALMDALEESGVDMGSILSSLMDIREGETKNDQLSVLMKSGLDEDAFGEVVGHIMGTELTTDKGNSTQYSDYLESVKAGLKPEQALQMQQDGIDLEDFLKLTDAGLKTDLAAKLVTQIHELKPEAGKDRVTDVQKWRAACAVSSDPKEQIAALEMVMDDTAFRKLNIGYEHGVDPAAYVRLREILPRFDANGSGSYSHDEIEAAINSMSASGLVLPGGDGTIFYLTTAQKAALWQLWSTSSSAKNNPYDTDIGWAVIEAKKAE